MIPRVVVLTGIIPMLLLQSQPAPPPPAPPPPLRLSGDQAVPALWTGYLAASVVWRLKVPERSSTRPPPTDRLHLSNTQADYVPVCVTHHT